ncbi:MAG TPA: hypothetical protein V6D17_03460 [Candidatus Obscuribacterales bacterium]
MIELNERTLAVQDPAFMRSCLTTNIADPRMFLSHIGQSFGRPVTEKAHEEFAQLLERDLANFQIYPDAEPALMKEDQHRIGMLPAITRAVIFGSSPQL